MRAPRLAILAPALALCLALTPAAAAGSATAQPSVAPSASALQLGRLYFDPPGDDLPKTNAKVNKEYVVVKNTSSSTVKLAGWSIKDAANHTFVFPSGFSLAKGKSVTVRTGKGTNTASTLYWGQGNYVWNNTGDTARLLDTKKKQKDTCTYTSTHKTSIDC